MTTQADRPPLRSFPRLPRTFAPAPAMAELVRNLPPLLVLTAPRGYGKTSTVAHWMRSGILDDATTAWLSIGTETGPADLWAALYDCLVTAGVAPAGGGVARPGPAHVRQVLGGLSGRLILVIDGLHHVPEHEVDAVLVDFVQNHELLHVIATTRAPRLLHSLGPIAVDAVVVNQTDLSLGAEQTAQIASQLGLELSETEAGTLAADLAGWPALVRGVLLDSWRGEDGHLHIDTEAVARFAKIVLRDPQSADWYPIVTALAVPESFTPMDHRAMFAPERVDELVEQVLASPFVSKVGPATYAVRPAVRAALREVLRDEDPDRLRRLSEIIARRRWDAQQPREALEHAVDAEVWPLVLAILEDHWAELLGSHRVGLRVAVDALPVEIVESSARLVVARDYVLDTQLALSAEHAIRSGLLTPDAELRVRPLTTTERLVLRFDGQPTPEAAGILLGRLDSELRGTSRAARSPQVVRAIPELLTQWGLALLYENDAVGAAYGFALACRKAVEGADAVAAREAATGAGMAMALLGHLQHAQAWLARGLTLSEQTSPLEAVVRPMAHGVLAGLRLRPPQDPSWLTAGVEVDRGLTPLVELARLAAAHRDIHLGRGERAAVELHRPPVDDFAAGRGLIVAMRTLVHADLALLDGDLEKQSLLLPETSSDDPLMRAARARQALYTGALQETLRRTKDAVSFSGLRPRAGLELLLVRACALVRLGDRSAASDALASAMAIAVDTGVLLPFVTVPRNDLETIAGQDSYARAFLDSLPLAGAPCPFPEPLRVDELSEAELRVLQELAGDRSLARIARALFVSESTVKTHARRIYRKLGVGSRAAAVVRARALMLLS